MGRTTQADDDAPMPIDADCGCSALLSCFAHYGRVRGRPAVRPISASEVFGR